MPDPVIFTAVGGTHDYQRGQWFWCHSPFAAWMATQGFTCRRPDFPFWSTALGGIPLYKTRIWTHGALVLKDWIERELPTVADRNVIAVSHGGQVAFHAAADGLELNSLTVICMPQRHDMDATYRAGLAHVKTFTNVYSDSWWRDRWQLLGCLADGSIRIRRRMKLDGVPVVNIGVKGVGHTELVRTEKMVQLRTAGVLDRIRGV